MIVRDIARRLLALLALALLPATVNAAAEKGSPAKPADPTEIVVKGIPDGPYPVTVGTNAGSNFAIEAGFGAQAAADARLFSRCISQRDNATLRLLIDDVPNGNRRQIGLDRLVRSHESCYPGFSSFSMWKSDYYGQCNPRGQFEPVMDGGRVVGAMTWHAVCQAFFDRGAILEKVLTTFAPDLTFTTAQLFDPAVLARFHAREDRFDKSRSKEERIYAQIAACTVAVHPEIAFAYLRNDLASAGETKVRNALIGLAPQCVGGATKVAVDPSFFRVYVADAIYSWAVALRGTDSLIPQPAKQGAAL